MWRGEIPLGSCYVGGVLRKLDLSDLSVHLNEVRDYLVAQYSRRLHVHWRHCQDAVVSVLGEVGYELITVGYMRDGGLDAVLRRGEKTVGVQVKRWKDSIEVEQIHSFYGALVRAGLTHGIFVTMSRFRRGAHRAADEFRALENPVGIELVDGAAFFEALKIAQRDTYHEIRDIDLTHVVQNLEHLELDESASFFPGV